MYEVIVLEQEPRAEKMAQLVDGKINEMEKNGYKLMSLTQTTTAKTILVFKQNWQAKNHK